MYAIKPKKQSYFKVPINFINVSKISSIHIAFGKIFYIARPILKVQKLKFFSMS